MQVKSLKLKGLRQDGIPILDHVLDRMKLRKILGDFISHERHVCALLLLIKNILIDHQALYAVARWSRKYDPDLVYGGKISDDTLARTLDKLFDCDRATLQTKVVLHAIKEFGITVDQIHNDSTSVKVCGQYQNQNKKAIQLKRGHSKDHRPDLKQFLYSLTVTADGAIPIHFKSYDGNVTDDTTHWETWSTIRALLRGPDFLYVADSKLCTEQAMRKIDANHGNFITVMPRIRRECREFYEETYDSQVRWCHLYKKRCTRKKIEYDIFEVAENLYQTREGFRIHWYRSSKKRERDRQNREERIDLVMDCLKRLGDEKRRGPKSEKSLLKACDKILGKYKTRDWIQVEVQIEDAEVFKKKNRGRPSQDELYRRVIKKKASLNIKKNREAIDRSTAIDGIFPLVTNKNLSALDTLKAYKYQPYLEKRHSLYKTTMEAAPVWIKKNERIEALAFVLFLSQLTAAILERELRSSMKKHEIQQINSLPEGRASKTPTLDQIVRLFENRAYHVLYSAKAPLKTFSDPLTDTQKQVLDLLGIPQKTYLR